MPEAAAGAKAPQRSGLVAGPELDLAAHALGDGLQCWGPVHGGDSLELVGRGAGPLQVARGQCDFHLRGQKVAPGKPVPGFIGERAPDRCARGLHLALRQAEKCHAGLWVPAHLVRLPERLRGRHEIAQPETDLSELVEGFAGRAHGVRTQLLASVGGLARGIRQRAPETQDAGPVHAAHARESEDALAVAPVARGVSPLASAPVVGEATANVDRVAEDVARGERAEGTAHRGHGSVLEERQPLGHLAFGDQEPPLLLQLKGGQVAVSQARREGVRSASMGESLVRILGQEPACPQQVAVLDRVLLLGEELLGAPYPPVRLRALALGEVVVAQKESQETSTALVTALEIGRVRTLPNRDALVEPPDPLRGLGQQLEILRRQGLHRVGGAQLLEGLAPRMTPERFAAGSKLIVSAVSHRWFAG